MIRSIPFALVCFLIASDGIGQAGTLDTDFGVNGFAETVFGPLGSGGAAVAVQPDGRILQAGVMNVDGGSDGAITRRMPDGTIDLSFALNGYLMTSSGVSGWLAMALLPDGKIVVAGNADIAGQYVMARFLADGSLDPAFGVGGLTGVSYPVSAMALLPNGRILLVGSTATEHTLSRYLEDGTSDATFGQGGSVVSDLGADQAIGTSLVVEEDGQILVAGSSTVDGEQNVSVARYTPNGTLDPGFGNGGSVSTECGSTTDSGEAIAVQADGRIVVAVEYPTGFVVLRYLADGTLDADFGVDGQVYTQVGPNQSYAKDIIVQPDGALLVGGRGFENTGWSFAVVRYLTDGSLDATWGNAGIAQTSNLGVSYWPEDMELQPDGRLVIAGSRQFSGSRFCMIRYFTDLTTTIDGPLTDTAEATFWPNPVSSSASFRLEEVVSGPLSFDVFDPRGVRVAQGQATPTASAGASTFTIDVGWLSSGCYLLSWNAGRAKSRFMKD